MKRLMVSILISCLATLQFNGETVNRVVSVFFRNGVDKVEMDYRDNADRFVMLDSIFATINADTTLTLSKIELAGWASPPASVEYNIELSHRRANSIQDWLRDNCIVPVDSMVITYNGVNYQLLGYMVEDRDYRYADEVLEIICDVPASVNTDRRQSRLRRLRNGQVWRELEKDYYPEMRRTDVIVSYDFQPPVVEPDIVTIEEVPTEVFETIDDPIPEEHIPVFVDQRANRYWSLHTNLLYDALVVPNLGAELYLGKNFSIAGNWHYAWWDKDRKHRYWRTYGGYIASRYWFGKAAAIKPLTGHHLGLYAQMLLYDFEWGGTGYLSGTPYKNIFTHPTWAAGLEYGFSLPIKRRLNIDFTIGFGYLEGLYRKYNPMDDAYMLISTNKLKWFGPTKLEISLVWLLGHGNYNSKKGGDK